MKIPLDYEIQPLKIGEKAKDKATCGHCNLSWDDGISTSMTPTPSGRCPFEPFHKELEREKAIETVEELIDDSNENHREYYLNHDDSPMGEFVAGCSYGEDKPDYEKVIELIETEFHKDSEIYEVLGMILDESDRLDELRDDLLELAELDCSGIYNPRGAILYSQIVGELENQVPEEATALIEKFNIQKSELNLEYYINDELTYSYMDCSYDVMRLILKDSDKVIECITDFIKAELS